MASSDNFSLRSDFSWATSDSLFSRRIAPASTFITGRVYSVQETIQRSLFELMDECGSMFSSKPQKTTTAIATLRSRLDRGKPRPCVLVNDKRARRKICLMATFEGTDDLSKLPLALQSFLAPVAPTVPLENPAFGNFQVSTQPEWTHKTRQWLIVVPYKCDEPLYSFRRRPGAGGEATDFHLPKADVAWITTAHEAKLREFKEKCRQDPVFRSRCFREYEEQIKDVNNRSCTSLAHGSVRTRASARSNRHSMPNQHPPGHSADTASSWRRHSRVVSVPSASVLAQPSAPSLSGPNFFTDFPSDLSPSSGESSAQVIDKEPSNGPGLRSSSLPWRSRRLSRPASCFDSSCCFTVSEDIEDESSTDEELPVTPDANISGLPEDDTTAVVSAGLSNIDLQLQTSQVKAKVSDDHCISGSAPSPAEDSKSLLFETAPRRNRKLFKRLPKMPSFSLGPKRA
ncbi:hypothetical protein HGRIS_000667 [Hohenbuehelia grisea]|uniref:Uncharacterized protein n=1 Tax=Hohenbuehelia grisea TaxID=104357 RepID=A0ABR3JTQ6_9AGAR